MNKLLDLLFGKTKWMISRQNEHFWEGWREGRQLERKYVLDVLSEVENDGESKEHTIDYIRTETTKRGPQ